MAAPLISVILPTYNAARTIAEAIDSVLAQTFRDFELIVVDDGSTDGTPEVLKQYRGKLHSYRIRNRGGAGARNYGVAKSRGRLLAFLDADDRWHTEKLARSVQALREHPGAVMVCTALRLIGPKGEILTPHVRIPIRSRYYPYLLLRNCFSPQGSLIKREVFLQYGGYCAETNLYEDWPLWNRIARNHRIVVLDEALFDYRGKSPVPYSEAEIALRIERQLKVLAIAFQEDLSLSGWFRARCRAAVYLDLAKACLYRKQFNLVAKLTLQSIRHMPFQFTAYTYLPLAVARKVLRVFGVTNGKHPS